MKILLTGASGFCGAQILDVLKSFDCSVWAVSRHWPSKIRKNPVTEYIETDLTVSSGLPKRIDSVIHAAARLSVSCTTADEFRINNIEVTRQLIEYAINAGASRFIFFSAMSVYGDTLVPVIDENTPVVNPDDYGQSKLKCEQLLSECAEMMPSVSLRLPSIMGVGAKHGWLTKVLESLRNDCTVHFKNPDTQFNNAIHLDDLSSFIIHLLEIKLKGSVVANLSLTGQMAVGKLLNVLKSKIGSNSYLVGYEDLYTRRFLIDSTLARETLGWKSITVMELAERVAGEIY